MLYHHIYCSSLLLVLTTIQLGAPSTVQLLDDIALAVAVTVIVAAEVDVLWLF